MKLVQESGAAQVIGEYESSIAERASSFLEFFLVDLAAREALLEDIERGSAGRGMWCCTMARSPEPADHKDNHGDNGRAINQAREALLATV